jgi:lipopolysaccharide/colanic/teichoic acid biosynthesis glycosyltransferase
MHPDSGNPAETLHRQRTTSAPTYEGEDTGQDNTPAPPPPPPLLPSSVVRWDKGKRVLDVLLSAILLILSAPVMLVAGLLVKLTSRGPMIYSQTRVGRNRQPFTIYKLRTMYEDCEKVSGARWCRPGDPRVTLLGRFLRKTHIDELPQLWNVLRGDMSLVGPRPERPEFVPQLEQVIPHYGGRLVVRPGLTGLAQLQLPPDTNLDSVRLKLAYDLYYVQKRSPWFDLRLQVGTVFHVVGFPPAAIRFLIALPDQQTIEKAYLKRLHSGNQRPGS